MRPSFLMYKSRGESGEREIEQCVFSYPKNNEMAAAVL
jgi:hypothetical protein